MESLVETLAREVAWQKYLASSGMSEEILLEPEVARFAFRAGWEARVE
jgi:hypothetical protein